MELRLTIKNGGLQGQGFTVREGESLVLGRGSNCDLQVFDEGLSRSHCRIEGKSGRFLITDLGSSNGTYVNSGPVKSADLRDGDRIQVGTTVIDCEFAGPSDAPGGSGQTTVGVIGEEEHTLLRPRVRRKAAPDSRDYMSYLAGPTGDAAALERAHKTLSTLYKVGTTINSATNLNDLYRMVVESILDVTHADEVALLMVRPGERPSANAAEIVASQRCEDELAGEFIVSHTVLDDVLTQGLMILSQDAQDDARFRAGQSIILGNIRSVMCAPVQAQGEILGALYVDSRRMAGAFSENDVELLATLGVQAGIALHRTRLLDRLENLFFGTVRALAATVDAKDGYTHHHSERVAAFAVKLARGLDFPETDREKVQLASLLHDIGKIGVHDLVLNKQGRLTDEEYAEMKRHPVHGAEILRTIQHPDVDELIPGIRHHHERFDGGGYPDGLAGEAIPLIARVISVADTLDAITSHRAYRPAQELNAAVAEIQRCSGTQFDPRVARALAGLFERGELNLPHRAELRYEDLTASAMPALGRSREAPPPAAPAPGAEVVLKPRSVAGDNGGPPAPAAPEKPAAPPPSGSAPGPGAGD